MHVTFHLGMIISIRNIVTICFLLLFGEAVDPTDPAFQMYCCCFYDVLLASTEVVIALVPWEVLAKPAFK